MKNPSAQKKQELPYSKGKNLLYYYNTAFILIFLAGILFTWKNGIQDFQNFEKHFSGRATLIKTFSNIRFFLLRDTIFSSVLVDRQNTQQPWLVYTGEMSLDDYQNTIPFTKEQLATIQKKLDQLQSRLNERNIKFYLVITPSKNTIYPEFFPSEIPIIGTESRLDQLIKYQKNFGQLQIIDLRDALFLTKQTNSVYYATDSHWNEYGAYIGYYQIASDLQADFPEIQPFDIDDYELVHEEFETGDLSKMLGQLKLSEGVISFHPTYQSQVSSFDTSIDGKDYVITTQPDSHLPTVVVFRDSFFTALIPYLSEHFSRAVYVWSFDYDEDLIEKEKPDIVIIECNERYIHYLLNLP